MTLKRIFLTLLLALGLSGFWHLNHDVLAVIQLDDSLRPPNLPSFSDITSQAMEDAQEGQAGEVTATTATILFVGNLLSQILVFVGSLTIIFLIVSGVNYILAFGKDERIERGKRGIFWSLMGLLIVLVSYAAVKGMISLLLQLDSSAT